MERCAPELSVKKGDVEEVFAVVQMYVCAWMAVLHHHVPLKNLTIANAQCDVCMVENALTTSADVLSATPDLTVNSQFVVLDA